MRGAFAIGAVGLAMSLAPAAVGDSGAPPASAPCPVPRLTHAQKHRAHVDMRREARRRRRERAHDLMGYRRGPRLGPPSRRERRLIREVRGDRLFLYALNPNRLLIRRLLRDHSKVVQRAWDYVDIPATAVEQRDMAFQDRFINSQGVIERYGPKCARDTYAGEYPTQHWPEGVHLYVLFTGDLRRHERALRARYPYARMMTLRRARFTLAALQATRRRVDRDWDEGDLDRAGVHPTDTYIDDGATNRVIVGLKRVTRAARDELHRRYGPMVAAREEDFVDATGS